MVCSEGRRPIEEIRLYL